MTWSPALDGANAIRARAFVAAAADELARRTIPDPSLGFGLTGVAMLHGYRALAGEAGPEIVTTTLERVLENIMEHPYPWLFMGYAGVAFTVDHLRAVIDPPDELLADLDPLIVQPLEAERWTHEWELQSGLIGLGVYAHARGLEHALARTIKHLAARADRGPAGLTWKTHETADNYNLGICHGVAGAVAFLSFVCADRDAPPEAEALLRESVPWLRSCERPTAIPRYPMQLGTPSPAPPTDGTPQLIDGWCYGDPSTALVLVRAGQLLQEASWIVAGQEIARRSAALTDLELAPFLIDDTLCHGRIGRAHLFHHLAICLEDAELMTAARRWYVRALDEIAPLETLPYAGLQTGLAGIALAMLGGYSELAPRWGRPLLIM